VTSPRRTTAAAFRRMMRDWARQAHDLYMVALSVQALGGDASGFWASWSVPVAGLLVGSWGLGSARIVKAGKTQKMLPLPEGGLPVSILGYEAGATTAVQARFAGLVPMTRREWAEVSAWAAQKAGEMALHESREALPAIMRQSPQVAALLTGAPDPSSRVFYASGLDSEQVKRLHLLVAKALADRGSVKSLRGDLRKAGLGDYVQAAQLETARNLSDARLEMVLRTNMSAAQTRGEDATLAHPVVKAFVPLLEWSAVGDARTRPTHAAMDGFVGTLEDFQHWRVGPPGGFQCRCGRIPMPVETAISRGFVRPDGTIDRDAIDAFNGPRLTLLRSGQFPDPGFVA